MRARSFSIVVGILSLTVGCSIPEREGSAVARRSQAQETAPSEVRTVSIAIPSGGDLSQWGLVANGALRLRDRASVIDAQGTKIPLYNLGHQTTELGVNVTTRDIESAASVFLQNYAKVLGNLTTNGVVQKQAGAQVVGTTTEQAPAFSTQTFTFEQSLASNSTDPRTIDGGVSATLAPGAYGKLSVNSGGSVSLRSGSYAFSDFQIERDAVLDIQLDGATPLVIYVDRFSAFRGRIESNADTAKAVVFVYTGTSTARFESTAELSLVAPHATVELATGGTVYRGSVFAQGVHLEPDVKLSHVPFEYWDWLLPPRPFVSCVMPSGRGHFVAAFGYDNGHTSALSIAPGPSNRFDPDPGSSHVPPDTFQPGHHDRVAWVPMPDTGITWNVHGQSATATKDSPGCKFVATEVPRDQPRTEGRPLPRPSMPPVPAPFKGRIALANASGPGSFDGFGAISSQMPPSFDAEDPEESPPDAKSEVGKAPAIPVGYQEQSQIQVTLKLKTKLHNDTGLEGERLDATSNVNGNYRSEDNININSNLEAHWTHTVTVNRGQDVPITFRQVEQNNAKPHEVVAANLTLKPDGQITGAIESGKIDGFFQFDNWKSWVGGLPFPELQSYTQFAQVPVHTTIGQTNTFGFYDDNEIEYTVLSPPSVSSSTRVCANWTAYFVDEAIPTLDGVSEGFTGTPLPGASRLRYHPASFAFYDLRVKGESASFRDSGQLDQDGCVSVPANALIYQDAVVDGSQGGVSFFMAIATQFVVNSPAGDATFFVAEEGDVAFQVFQYNRFDDVGGFSLVNGRRVPPTQFPVTAPHRTHATTTAATISHVLGRMAQLGVSVPPGSYPVVLGGGSRSGTFDFKNVEIPDAAFTPSFPNTPMDRGQINVGPAFFPGCDPDDDPGCQCESPRINCRSTCLGDAQCAGGQHCAKEDDAADGCEGGTCFCAYASQGTSKFVLTHELGHMFQDAFTGGFGIRGYEFDCPDDGNGNCLPNMGRLNKNGNGLLDPPLMDETCGCQHVTIANALHCLQSIEDPSTADGEGHAHFFASLIWNDPSAPTCRFNYYKEILDVGSPCRVSGDPEACDEYMLRSGELGTVTLPPASVDCGTPTKWRNQSRCMVDPSAQKHLSKPYMGTEYDWMTFLYATTRQVGYTELMSVYNHACHPEHAGLAAGLAEVPCGTESPLNPANPGATRTARNIAWTDFVITQLDAEGNPALDSNDNPIVVEYGGFLSGAERKWGALSTEADSIDQLGDEHGVSEDTSPLVP